MGTKGIVFVLTLCAIAIGFGSAFLFKLLEPSGGQVEASVMWAAICGLYSYCLIRYEYPSW